MSNRGDAMAAASQMNTGIMAEIGLKRGCKGKHPAPLRSIRHKRLWRADGSAHEVGGCPVTT